MSSAAIALDVPRAESRPRGVPRWLWLAVPLLVLLVIFFYPLFFIIKQSLTGDSGPVTLAHYATVLSSGVFKAALGRTIEIAVLSTIGCLALGFALALIVAFVPFPGSRVVSDCPATRTSG